MAGLIPREFIQDVLNRTDLVELIDARVSLKRTGNHFTARCPFHNEKTPSFSVRRDKQFYHCFGCGAHGNAIGFLMDYERLGFVEAIELLAEKAGMPMPSETTPSADNAKGVDLKPLLDIQDQAARYYSQQLKSHPEAAKAVDYLKHRGVSGEMARQFRLGYAPPGWRNLPADWPEESLIAAGLVISKDDGKTYDRFRDRIMFPIRNKQGQIIGFGGRVLNDDTPKYLNSPETAVFKKHRELFGLYETLKAIHKPERILVVEGYMDVIALAGYGIHYAVATLGTATSGDHIQTLFRYTSELVFCFDGDSAGQKAAWRALEAALPHLREGRQVRFLLLPQSHDPDSLIRTEGTEDFLQRVGSALPFSEYFFTTLSQPLDMSSIESRSSLVKSAAPLIQQIPQGVFRNLLDKRLVELTGCDPQTTAPKAERIRPPSQRVSPQGSSLKPSLMRIFLALLLYEPALAQLLTPSARERIGSSPKGGQLAQKILALLHENPELTSGALEEIFRDEPEENFIRELLAWAASNIVPEQMEAEFKGTVERLERRINQHRLDTLIEKSTQTTLTPEEQDELLTLLKGRVD